MRNDKDFINMKSSYFFEAAYRLIFEAHVCRCLIVLAGDARALASFTEARRYFINTYYNRKVATISLIGFSITLAWRLSTTLRTAKVRGSHQYNAMASIA